MPDFADVLHRCVHAGANISFVLPFEPADAVAFWREKVLPVMPHGKRLVLCARIAGAIAGTVQLDWNMPPNQTHRADVMKLMVHPHFRRRGVARALMRELENRAIAMGLTLLVLDTRTGDKAEPLYTSLGYDTAGAIPNFCVDPITGELHGTTYMYKELSAL